MKLRLVINLLIAVAAVWALTLILNPADREVELSGRLLPETLVTEADFLSFQHGALTAELQRVGHVWTIQRPINAPTDRSAILRILSALDGASRSETVTADDLKRRELTAASYGLATPRASMTLRHDAQSRTILFGDDAPLGNRIYVRLSGSDDIIAIARDSYDALPASLAILRDTAAFRGDPNRTRQVEIRRPDRPFVKLNRVGSKWRVQQPVDSEADSHNVDSMLRSLYELRVARFIYDPPTEGSTNLASAQLAAYGLTADEAMALINTTQPGAAPQGIMFGRAVQDMPEEVYARLTTTEAIFTVPRSSLDTILVDFDMLRSRSLFSILPRQVKFVRLQSGKHRLLLERSEAGLWNITEPMTWSADPGLVTELINLITALTIHTFPATTNTAPTNAAPVAVIQLGQAREEVDEQTANRLLVMAGGPGVDTVAVRRATDEDSFGVLRQSLSPLLAHVQDGFHFADRTVLSLTPDGIRNISIHSNSHAVAAIRQTSPGIWMAETDSSRRVNPAAIEALLFEVANLRAVRILGQIPDDLRPYGLDKPGFTVTMGLGGSNGIERALHIGRRADSPPDSRYATVRGMDLLFQLGPETLAVLSTNLFEGPVTAPPPRAK